MSLKEQQELLVKKMRAWQKIENAAVTQTAKIMERTEHPLIRAVAEIIQNDSKMHFRIQQLIVDSFEKSSIPVLTDQLEAVWDAIEEHIRIEKRTIELAQESLKAIEGSRNAAQQYLLGYLLADEKKHDKLLADLDLIKKNMFP